MSKRKRRTSITIYDARHLLAMLADTLAQDGLQVISNGPFSVSIDDVETMSCMKYSLCFFMGILTWIAVCGSVIGFLVLGALVLGFLLWYCWWLFLVLGTPIVQGYLLQRQRVSKRKRKEKEEENGKDI